MEINSSEYYKKYTVKLHCIFLVNIMSLQYKYFNYGSEDLLTRYLKNITYVIKNLVLFDFTDTFLYRGKQQINTYSN